MPKTTALSAYGSLSLATQFADLFAVVKSSSSGGTYGSGTTRKANADLVRQILNVPLYGNLTVPVASIKTANTLPVALITAPGIAGYYIDILSAAYKFTYNGIAYDPASGYFDILTSGKTGPFFTSPTEILKSTSNAFVKMNKPDADITELADNTSVVLKARNNSTVGDGTLQIFLQWQVVPMA